MIYKRFSGLIFSIIFSLFFISGCKLVFEPANHAIDRLFKDWSSGSDRYAGEMIPDESLLKSVSSMRVTLSSDLFNNVSGFWAVSLIEEESDTGLSFVYVTVTIPERNGQRALKQELVFEMRRIKLRWYIYSIRGLESFIRSANRARGIG